MTKHYVNSPLLFLEADALYVPQIYLELKILLP